MASGSQRSSMTNYICPRKIFTKISGSSMTGSQGTKPVQTTSIEESCRRARKPSTSLSAETRTRRGSLCWRKLTPKPTATMLPYQEVGWGKSILDSYTKFIAYDHLCREGLEDLTGGVTTELFTADILDKDKFWNDELMNVNKLFLFGLAQMGGVSGERKGIVEQHAYSIMEAREFDNLRLLKVRYALLCQRSACTRFVSYSEFLYPSIKLYTPLTPNIEIHGARRNGMELGVTAPKNGRLIVCVD